MKKLLFTISIALLASSVYAQHFISATEFYNGNAHQVQTYLNNDGWDTSPMTINGVIGYKIIYKTTDVFGNPTIASGALYVPQIDCDTLPFVSWQHGTVFEKSYCRVTPWK